MKIKLKPNLEIEVNQIYIDKRFNFIRKYIFNHFKIKDYSSPTEYSFFFGVPDKNKSLGRHEMRKRLMIWTSKPFAVANYNFAVTNEARHSLSKIEKVTIPLDFSSVTDEIISLFKPNIPTKDIIHITDEYLLDTTINHFEDVQQYRVVNIKTNSEATMYFASLLPKYFTIIYNTSIILPKISVPNHSLVSFDNSPNTINVDLTKFPQNIQNLIKLSTTKQLQIFVNFKCEQTAYGGGNQFLLKLIKSHKNASYKFELQQNIDYYLIMDVRSGSRKVYKLEEIIEHKKKFNPNSPIILRINDCDYTRDEKKIDKTIIDNLTNFDHIVFNSLFIKNYFFSNYYINFKDVKFSIFYNSVDMEIFYHISHPPSTKPKIVTHHWSDNINKGYQIYYQLFQQSKIHFDFIGRKFNDAFIPQPKIVPQLSGVELCEKLNEYDIYVSASIYDSCPMHILEALACNLPILYLNQPGGVKDICTNLFTSKVAEPFENIEDLMEKIKLMHKNIQYYRGNIEREFKTINDNFSKAYVNFFNYQYYGINFPEVNYDPNPAPVPDPIPTQPQPTQVKILDAEINTDVTITPSATETIFDSKYTINVGITATNRPLLHNRSLTKWINWINKSKHPVKYIINIDVLSGPKYTSTLEDTVENFVKMLNDSEYIILEQSEKPTHFLACEKIAKVIKESKPTHVFWLEDDWELIDEETYNINDIISNYMPPNLNICINFNFIRRNYIWALAPSIMNYELWEKIFYDGLKYICITDNPEDKIGKYCKFVLKLVEEKIYNITLINKKVTTAFFQEFLIFPNSYFMHILPCPISYVKRDIKNVKDIVLPSEDTPIFMRISPKICIDIGRK